MKNLFQFVICAAMFVLSSCQPDAPSIKRYTSMVVTDLGHGAVEIQLNCSSPTGPDCLTACSNVLNQTYRQTFETFKTYYYNNDVPGFIQQENWRTIFPDLPQEIADKLESEEYKIKFWEQSSDELVTVVQRVPGNDYSVGNVAYSFRVAPCQ